jgi:hypothetical protein
LQERQPSRSSFEQDVTKLNSKQILARADIVAVAVITPGDVGVCGNLFHSASAALT